MSLNNEFKENNSNSLSFLNKLNQQQKEAVIFSNSPQLVLSGAGSGKTRVLTYKIVYLIKIMNIPSYNILALTFTNKAANEMKQRISKLIGEEYTKSLHIGTFHSIFCKILRKNISFLDKNYKSNFQIIDEDEVKKIIRNILEQEFYDIIQNEFKEKGINDKIKSTIFINDLVKKIVEKISLQKNKGITYEDYHKLSNEIEKDKLNGFEYLNYVYELYVKECKNKNLMDFDDLILNTFILFKNNISILEKYQQTFKYILVDEYQDTNHVQFEILKALSWQSHNICAVGDDCQSIYSFRGADLTNFKNFMYFFPETKQFKLNQNYRSTSNIIKVADSLIKHNKNQIEKNLFSKINEIDGKVKLLISETGFEESEKIGFIIKNLIKEKKCEYKDIAILFRINLQSYIVQKVFFKRDIPHRLCNRIGFYETKIIQNIFAYLKYIINPLDIWLKKIIDYPRRGIGEVSKNKLFSIAKSNNTNGWEIINNCDNEEKIKEYKINKDLQKKLLPFKNLILYLRSIINIKNLHEIVSDLIENVDLRQYLKNDSSSLEKINMLLEKIEEQEQDHITFGLGKLTLNEFLEETSLLLGNEENYDKKNSENENKVNLMTIHQAKGLEFKYVFVIGLEEGFYPCHMCMENDDEIEEERRILYVAITRAKINCYFSYAKSRLIGDKESKRFASRFIDEINTEELVQVYNPPLFKEYLENNKILDIKSKKEIKVQKPINNGIDSINEIENNIYKEEKNTKIKIKKDYKNKDKDKDIDKHKDKHKDKDRHKNKEKEKEKDSKNENENDNVINANMNNKNNMNNNGLVLCKENSLIIIDENKDKKNKCNNNDKEKKKKNKKKKENKNNENLIENKKDEIKEEEKDKNKNKNVKKNKKELLNKKRINNTTLDSFVIFK